MLWLTALAVSAQRTSQDYVVTAKGDTLRGQIQLTGKREQTVTLYRPQQNPISFTAADAISYGDTSGPIGVSKLVGAHGRAPTFVTPLVLGYVSLYSGTNMDGARRFYLQPTDSTYIVEVLPASPLLTLLRLLPGCPSLKLEYTETLRSYPYTPTGMSRLITDYNACRRPQQASFSNRHPYGLHTTFSFKAGVNTSRFTTSAYESFTGNHTQSFGYQASTFFHFYSKARTSVLIEPTYITLRSVYGPRAIPNGYAYYTTTRRTAIHYAQVQIPLLIRYTVGHSNWRPYLNAGSNCAVSFSNRSVQEYHHSVDSNQPAVPLKDQTYAITALNDPSLGFAAGAGLLLCQPSFPTLSAELRYDYMLDSFGPSSINHNLLRLDLGVMF